MWSINITTINRKGSVGGTEFDDIDNIALTYNGNQLMSANDLSDPNHQNYGFVDDLEAKLNIEY